LHFCGKISTVGAIILTKGTTIIHRYLQRPARWQWPLFVALVAYYCIAMTIVAPVEGDGIAIAVASQHLLENNIVGTAAAYRPSFQPGTYALVELASKVTGLDTYTFFPSPVRSVALFLFTLVLVL